MTFPSRPPLCCLPARLPLLYLIFSRSFRLHKRETADFLLFLFMQEGKRFLIITDYARHAAVFFFFFFLDSHNVNTCNCLSLYMTDKSNFFSKLLHEKAIFCQYNPDLYEPVVDRSRQLKTDDSYIFLSHLFFSSFPHLSFLLPAPLP